MKVSTEILKNAVAKAVKGVGNNKLIPITSLMCIELKDNTLTLVTTDATNYLYVREDKISGNDFYVVVDANVFSKLVSKMTCDTIEMTIDNYTLTVKGNGKYKIELPIDEDGQLIKYPNPIESFKMDSVCTVNKTTVQVILDTIKPALAVTLENPCYTGYYTKDKILATDSYKIACLNFAKPWFDEAKLLRSEFLDLVSVVQNETINVYVDGNNVVFHTDDCDIYGSFMSDEIEQFNIEGIDGLVNLEFEHKCSVPKRELLQTLDRLSLFVGPYDQNTVYMTFTPQGLQLSSKAANSIETINYLTSKDFTEYTCGIDIQMFMQEVKSISNDAIEINYGDDSCIKMTDGNITIIVALVDDESEDE